MALAFGREGRAVPPCPSLAALETSQLGHEVEFGGPGIAHEMGDHPRTTFVDNDALERDGLQNRIMNRDLEPDGVHPGPRTLHALTVCEAGKVRHHRLYDKHAGGVQVPGGVVEATHLGFLGRQVEDLSLIHI